MRVLLDENIPAKLYRRLRDADTEHLVLGQRGLPDEAIRARLLAEDNLVLLTQDTEFFSLPQEAAGKVIVSRLPQSLGTPRRVDMWHAAIMALLEAPSEATVFSLDPDGHLTPSTEQQAVGDVES